MDLSNLRQHAAVSVDLSALLSPKDLRNNALKDLKGMRSLTHSRLRYDGTKSPLLEEVPERLRGAVHLSKFQG